MTSPLILKIYFLVSSISCDVIIQIAEIKMNKSEAKNIMILGGSRIGKHIAFYMQKNCEVKLIDTDPKKCESLAEILDNTLIINGDGRSVDLLEQEGITKTDAFVAVTGNSETNILSCLLAKKMGVKKTIAEVENMEYIIYSLFIFWK